MYGLQLHDINMQKSQNVVISKTKQNKKLQKDMSGMNPLTKFLNIKIILYIVHRHMEGTGGELMSIL